MAQREKKLAELEERGAVAYVYNFSPTHHSKDIIENPEQFAESGTSVRIAGRLISLREHGKTTFAHLLDGRGSIQIYLRQNKLGQEQFQLFKLFDIGDFVGVEGTVFRTRTGEVTIDVESFALLAKSLRPLPEKWHGLRDMETRCRQRYADMIVNPSVKEGFTIRSRMIVAIRKFLEARGFIEVETPVLQPRYGGAFARPFVTHHQALDMPLYLRIADELYMKRLIIGGYDKIYEIGKDFRNEGMDRFHNPEFTMLEAYQAYADYRDIMVLVEQLFSAVARELNGSNTVTYQSQEVDLSPPWQRIPFFDALAEHLGQEARSLPGSELKRLAEELGLEVGDVVDRAKLLDILFSSRVQPHLAGPCFIIDYPMEMCPLAKQARHDPGLAERFEPFICGMEMGNAFTELNDPREQRRRLAGQARLREAGDPEAEGLDEDFLRAMEYGMPPTGGLGLGIDRMAMFFTDTRSIRDVIFFPQMRPEAAGEGEVDVAGDEEMVGVEGSKLEAEGDDSGGG
jgi:lysyl-tRNA synthetase class 2